MIFNIHIIRRVNKKEGMKILQITSQAPGFNSGGAIGVMQTLFSLIGNGYEVDYIGPEIEKEEIKSYYSKIYELTSEKSFFLRIFNLLKGISNSRYNSWKKLCIDFNQYDAVVLDFTKMDYILKRVDRRKLFVRVHNIEADYSYKDYQNRKCISKYIIMKLAKRQEKNIVDQASCLVVLTQEDKKRLCFLYGEKSNIKIIPVCLKRKIDQDNFEIKEGKLRLLITGSLWFGENYNGILWFIKNVCSKLRCNFSLTIAGAHPTNLLKNICAENHAIRLIDTPEDMDEIFFEADLVVAPIFDGAGMKVKIAEAFSYGIPVIGTSHVFIGYKIKNGENSFLANTESDFVKWIEYYDQLSVEKRGQIRNNVKKLFEMNYDIKVSQDIWKNIIEKNFENK